MVLLVPMQASGRATDGIQRLIVTWDADQEGAICVAGLDRVGPATARGKVGAGWTSAKDIVKASPMSLKFLEQILVDLKAGGI